MGRRGGLVAGVAATADARGLAAADGSAAVAVALTGESDLVALAAQAWWATHRFVWFFKKEYHFFVFLTFLGGFTGFSTEGQRYDLYTPKKSNPLYPLT